MKQGISSVIEQMQFFILAHRPWNYSIHYTGSEIRLSVPCHPAGGA